MDQPLFRPLCQKFNRYSSLRGKVLVIEGLVGVGKSTLGRSLTKWLHNLGLECKFFTEFFHPPLLEQYLQDMVKYAYPFQVIMIRERLNIYSQAQDWARKGNIAIIDRSILGDLAFATMQRDKGYISSKEWDVYQSLIERENIIQPSLTICLNCSPNEAYQRMLSRSISAEVNTYDLDYFICLNDAYQKVMNQHQIQSLDLDWHQPLPTEDHNQQSYLTDQHCANVAEHIFKFLHDLLPSFPLNSSASKMLV